LRIENKHNGTKHHTSLVAKQAKAKQTSKLQKAYTVDIRGEALDVYYKYLQLHPYKVFKLASEDVLNMLAIQGKHFYSNPYSKYLDVILPFHQDARINFNV